MARKHVCDEKNAVIFSRQIERIDKIDEDTWEVYINNPKFSGIVKIVNGEPEIVEVEA